MSSQRNALVEAMARAICAEDAECGPWDMAPRILRQALRDEATAALAAIEAAGFAVVPRKLLVEAQACMRATGWHLAPACVESEDGILEAACGDIEARLSDVIAASPVDARDE